VKTVVSRSALDLWASTFGGGRYGRRLVACVGE
jgi:hypothetical protein